MHQQTVVVRRTWTSMPCGGKARKARKARRATEKASSSFSPKEVSGRIGSSPRSSQVGERVATPPTLASKEVEKTKVKEMARKATTQGSLATRVKAREPTQVTA